MANWHYIGHYGQLGPLSLAQMLELVENGVVGRTTMVWTAGMPEWQVADSVEEFKAIFEIVPPPAPGAANDSVDHLQKLNTKFDELNPSPPPFVPPSSNFGAYRTPSIPPYGFMVPQAVTSEKSRILAGLLNIFLPGVGRMYLGFWLVGILELCLAFTGIGYIWAFFDGLFIIAGLQRFDGLGHKL